MSNTDEKREQLKAALDEARVDYAKNARTETLEKLLAEHEEQEKAKPEELVKAPDGPVEASDRRPDPSRRSVAAKGQKVDSVRVKVNRDMYGIPRRVFEHEVVILQSLFGEESVEVIEGTDRMEPMIGDAADEYDRLMRVYGRKGAEIVRQIYPTSAALADEIGISRPKRSRASRAGLELGEQSSQRGRGVD